MTIPQVGWTHVADKLDGLATVRHAVLTFNGTWGSGQVQYPSDVVNGLAQYVNPDLCYEVPVPGPYSFGPIGGSITAPSYQQSVQSQVAWAQSWIDANPQQTFALIGYSMGAECASRLFMQLDDDALTRFIGGITFGNPSRLAGSHAPTIVDPGGHGISPVRMIELPAVNGRVVWADYVHSPANGDPGLDMYASVPNGQVGQDMGDVYELATQLQFNNIAELSTDIVSDLQAAVRDLAKAPFAALQAAAAGIAFMAAPGGPTAPHISYLGEIGGYANLVADAVGFLHDIAVLTPARCAA